MRKLFEPTPLRTSSPRLDVTNDMGAMLEALRKSDSSPSLSKLAPGSKPKSTLSNSVPNVSDVSDSSELAPLRATKIVGTLGPGSIPKIRELIIAGLNCFRLNFSHITDPNAQTPIIEEIRRLSKELNIPVAILGDLCGPKIRCNDFGELPSITLVNGSKVILKSTSEPGSEGVITTKISQIISQLQPGHRILLDDGALQLVATESEKDGCGQIECEVVVGGVLKPRKGINVPDLKLDLSALTEKDAKDARYMYSKRLDYVALSFVQRAQDVKDLLNLFADCQHGSSGDDSSDEDLEDSWRPHIIAKIEKPQALEEIDDIIDVSDGIMVARGDLGVEVSLERVPVIQKMLIRKANLAEKPVITATQMLESMISSPVPTRAEVSDVANAVFDGTDAVMLSAECAVGQYPVETVKMMGSICLNSEEGSMFALVAPSVFDPENSLKGNSLLARPIADASVAAASEAKATAIIAFTTSGAMATYISKRRPARRIIAVTPTPSIYYRLALLYGVFPVLSSTMKLNHKKRHIFNLTHGTDSSDEALSGDDVPRPSTPQLRHAHVHPRNTDSIYAQTERDILELSKTLKTHEVCDELVRTGDTVVFVSGNYPLPGLNHTLKMTHFGDAIRSERRRHLWDTAVDWATHFGHHKKEKDAF